jgi:hypothetical protein
MNFNPNPNTAVSKGDRFILLILNMDTLFTDILERNSTSSVAASPSFGCCIGWGRSDLDFGFLFRTLFLFHHLSPLVEEEVEDGDSGCCCC